VLKPQNVWGQNVMILSSKFSYPSLHRIFFLSDFCLVASCFFLMWCHTVGLGSAVNTVYRACCAHWRQRGWLLIWRNGPWVL